jgi:hypothetical protein
MARKVITQVPTTIIDGANLDLFRLEKLEYVVWTQETPATQWGPIEHNFGRFPDVKVLVDGINEYIEGELIPLNMNKIVINWSVAYSGKATLM